ncbi:hypothetical protein ACFLZ8_02015 [Planctomycetota bacterium]
MDVTYITVEDGKLGPTLMANAGHVDIQLSETPDGETELSTIVASGGINYRDEGGSNFLGSKMFYDNSRSIITIEGNRIQPCYFNGALVDGIEINIKTGESKANLIGSSTMN